MCPQGGSWAGEDGILHSCNARHVSQKACRRNSVPVGVVQVKHASPFGYVQRWEGLLGVVWGGTSSYDPLRARFPETG